MNKEGRNLITTALLISHKGYLLQSSEQWMDTSSSCYWHCILHAVCQQVSSCQTQESGQIRTQRLCNHLWCLTKKMAFVGNWANKRWSTQVGGRDSSSTQTWGNSEVSVRCLVHRRLWPTINCSEVMGWQQSRACCSVIGLMKQELWPPLTIHLSWHCYCCCWATFDQLLSRDQVFNKPFNFKLNTGSYLLSNP